MKGYDEFNTILLPPRPPGEKLPTELIDYYDGK
jgi:hydrocephalus-inducing protein